MTQRSPDAAVMGPGPAEQRCAPHRVRDSNDVLMAQVHLNF